MKFVLLFVVWGTTFRSDFLKKICQNDSNLYSLQAYERNFPEINFLLTFFSFISVLWRDQKKPQKFKDFTRFSLKVWFSILPNKIRVIMTLKIKNEFIQFHYLLSYKKRFVHHLIPGRRCIQSVKQKRSIWFGDFIQNSFSFQIFVKGLFW